MNDLVAPGFLLETLRRTYGYPPPSPLLTPGGDPLVLLVLTILSQATNDHNAAKAYASLREYFPAWAQVAEAETRAVAETIAPGGLAAQKAPRIQAILRQIARERGDYDLGFLHHLDPAQSFAYLTALPGVGPKTAACTLLFAFGFPFFPADIHILRVGMRLGLFKEGQKEQAQVILGGLFHPAEYLDLHLYLIEHGRGLCRPRPKCGGCPLGSYCTFGNQSEVDAASGVASK